MSETFARRENNSNSGLAKKPNRKKIADKFNVTETFRITVQNQIDEFIEEQEQLTMKFPPSFTNIERGYIHTLIQKKGLKSKSHGVGSARQLMIYKPNSNTLIEMDATFKLHSETNTLALNYLHKNPLNQIDLGNLNKYCDSTIKTAKSMFNCSFGNSQYTITVPPISPILQQQQQPSQQNFSTNSIQEQRKQLPIYEYRNKIINEINKNQVTVISGDTGSGKTTQVPQYLLEEHCANNKKCRIICIQPRRLAAISIADRVSWERGEQVGHTIAYQIRLESRITLTSNLIYTTSGFFLRCLVSDQIAQFQSVTHIILDEVHERDRFTDFLLIAIKNELIRNKELKVILMSATLDSKVFCNYFNDCPLINIPGRMFPVDVYHLEETLAIVGFLDNLKTVKDYRQQKNQEQQQQQPAIPSSLDYNNYILNEPIVDLDPNDKKHIDEVLEYSFLNDDVQHLDQFYYLCTGEGVPVNYQHSQTKMTALMIAAFKGWLLAIENLIGLGANPFLDVNNITAKMWALSENHQNCYEYLQKYEMDYLTNKLKIQNLNESTPTNGINGGADINEQQFLLKTYMSKTNEVDIDFNLVFSIIKNIHMTKQLTGSILVFLPGYDTIVELNDTILAYQSSGEINTNLQILMLHGSMQAIDQKNVFLPPPVGYRKLILSTNIAETSLTIDDVVYVIDCGKVKQNTYDAVSGATSLTTTWISRACSKQRMGRAGRVQSGICYRLYSKFRHQNMDEYTLPEILRIPLTEISLNAKMLAGSNIPIAEFLAQAIQAPPAVSVKQSIELLKTIGALDKNENITQLGIHLIDLPVECQLGKTLIYAVLMKCIDPVLTIVSALSQKDPFVVGGLNNHNDNNAENNDRHSNRFNGDGGGFRSKNKSHEPACRATVQALSDKSFSDHLVLLRVYQQWCDAKANNKEREFCQDNFISNGSMQMICGIRSQILGHMRSVGFIQHKSQGNIHDLNKHSSNWSVVKGCFVAGMYPNICRIDRKQGNIKSRYENKLIPHVSSVLRDKNPKMCQATMSSMMTEWILFGEKSRVGRLCLIRCNTVVTPLSIALFSGPINLTTDKLINIKDDSSDNDDDDDEDDNDDIYDKDTNVANGFPSTSTTRYQIDDWLSFLLDTETAYTVQNLRQKLHSYLVRIIENPKKYHKEQNSDLIQIISDMLYKEDILVGFPQPKDVGRRPVSVNLKLAPDMNSGRPEVQNRFGQPSSSFSLSSSSQYFYNDANRETDATNRIILQKDKKRQPWKGKK